MSESQESSPSVLSVGRSLVRLIEAIAVLLPHTPDNEEHTLLEIVQQRARGRLKSLIAAQPEAVTDAILAVSERGDALRRDLSRH